MRNNQNFTHKVLLLGMDVIAVAVILQLAWFVSSPIKPIEHKSVVAVSCVRG